MRLAATTKQAGRCATILQLTTNPVTHEGTEQVAIRYHEAPIIHFSTTQVARS